MRVIIAVPNTAIPTAGAAYVAACVKRAGHTVDGHKFCGAEAAVRAIGKGYDVLMTGGLSCGWKEIETILNTAKGARLPTILGGGIVSAEPEIVTRALRPTYSVLGQGEVTAVEVLDVLQGKRPAETVPGLGYLKGEDYVQTAPREDVKDLDSLPFPDYEIFGLREALDSLRPSSQDYLSLWDHPREYALVASRSCPFHCTFCWHTSGNRYRRRSVGSVMAELKDVVPRYNINVVSILDELFGGSKDWLVEFCERMQEFRKELPQGLHWWAALRPTMAEPETLSLMKAAGCSMISYGFESYSQRVLDSMCKRTKPADIERAYRLTHDAGIAIMGQFIFGDPAETPETIEETLAFWKTHPDIFGTTIWACPDSANYRLAVKRGIIKDRLAHQKDIFRLLNLTTMNDDAYQRFAVRLLKMNILDVPWPKIRREADAITANCPHCRRDSTYRNFALPPLKQSRVICRNCGHRFNVSRNAYRRAMRILAHCTPEWAWPYRAWRKVRSGLDGVVNRAKI